MTKYQPAEGKKLDVGDSTNQPEKKKNQENGTKKTAARYIPTKTSDKEGGDQRQPSPIPAHDIQVQSTSS